MSKRDELADARIHLRDAQQTFEFVKATSEQSVIDRAAPAALANAEARTRSLAIALPNDPAYVDARAHVTELQNRVDRLQASIEEQNDERKDRDITAREKLADALLKLAPPVMLPYTRDDPNSNVRPTFNPVDLNPRYVLSSSTVTDQ